MFLAFSSFPLVVPANLLQNQARPNRPPLGGACGRLMPQDYEPASGKAFSMQAHRRLRNWDLARLSSFAIIRNRLRRASPLGHVPIRTSVPFTPTDVAKKRSACGQSSRDERWLRKNSHGFHDDFTITPRELRYRATGASCRARSSLRGTSWQRLCVS